MTIQESYAYYKRSLERADKEALALIRKTITSHLPDLRRRLATLREAILERQRAGLPVSPAWLYQEQRYLDTIRTVESIAKSAASARATLLPAASGFGRQLGVAIPGIMATEAAPGIAPLWGRADILAIRSIAASVSRGPLATLIDMLGQRLVGNPAYAGATAERIRAALVRGILLGQNPLAAAASVLSEVNATRAHLRTVFRTEMLRSYRDAASQEMANHGDMLDGWVWLAARDNRTCPVCWHMNGTKHSLGEGLASHPNCRCTQVPNLQRRLLRQNAEATIPSGDAEFAKLSAAEQRNILGPSIYKQYKAGNVTLADLVVQGHHPRWGPFRRRASLREVA